MVLRMIAKIDCGIISGGTIKAETWFSDMVLVFAGTAYLMKVSPV